MKAITWRDKEANPMRPLDPFAVTHFRQLQARLKMEGYCSSCAKEDQKLYDAARTKLWAELPKIFRLPCWEELLGSDSKSDSSSDDDAMSDD